ncbi:UNVERIFIED_CONTAM: protein MAIN-LIKE 2 [Sesamum radiatum]|uniref:Protein MAIN-LIKE 2 n=1 Tax=Sesamum radiatum TaxID=300843 RepID=A0AAW2P2I1_SESRA
MAPETHTFHFSVGEATVTLQDISIIWTLPIEDNLITGVDIKWTTQQWQNYCHQWLGFHPNENAFKHSRIKLSALLDWLLNNTCDDDSPFDDVLQEARVCVMCIIGGILCPDATADMMPTVIDLETSYPFLHMLHGDDAGPSNVYTPSGPSNVYNEAGPSNVYNEAGPSNVYNEAGPSNFFTPTGLSYAYTSNISFVSEDYAHNIHPETRRHLGISPVPFDGSDLNTPIEEPHDIHPRRNRRRPRCGTGGHY